MKQSGPTLVCRECGEKDLEKLCIDRSVKGSHLNLCRECRNKTRSILRKNRGHEGLCQRCGRKSDKYRCKDCTRVYAEWQSLNRGTTIATKSKKLARIFLLGTIQNPPKALINSLGKDIERFATEWVDLVIKIEKEEAAK